MRRMVAALLACALGLCLAGCAPVENLKLALEQKKAAENAPPTYAEILSAVRSQEENALYPIAAAQNGEEVGLALNPAGLSETDAAAAAQAMMEALDFQSGGLSAYAVSVALDGEQPYAVGIFMPIDSYEVLVKAALDVFIQDRQKLFPDSEVAQCAEVRRVDSGEYVLVMCPDSASTMDLLVAQLALRAEQAG